MRTFFLACALTLGLSCSAKASWLDEVFSEEYAASYGHPSITLNSKLGVSIVLQEQAIHDARAAGLSLQETATVFLGRYGPRLCSQVLDLNKAQPALKVSVIVQRTKTPETATARTRAQLRKIQHDFKALHPDVHTRHTGFDNLFEVARKGASFTIDYKPETPAKCVVPSVGTGLPV